MRFNLYYRLLLSYAPIFLVVFAILIFVFFSILNNTAKQQILETNEVISDQIVHSLDANLEVTERTVIREIIGNQAIKLFFNDNQKKTLYDYFYISQKLDEISTSMPFVSSIYLYDESDGIVLSRKDLIPAEQFADYGFIRSVYQSDALQGTWTSPRAFREAGAADGAGEQVVSLAKFYPLPKQNLGLLVVNIRVDSLFEYINRLNRNGLSLIKVYDADHRPFPENDVSWASNPKQDFDVKLIARKSDYTGWYFETGMKKNFGFSVMSILTDVWTILGFLTILAGIAWLTYVTHRNYKPVQAIVGRIHDYAGKKSGLLGVKTSLDEYKFIESAIENLMEKSIAFEKLHQDDLILRKKHFFLEMLEGNATLSEPEWREAMGKFGKPRHFSQLVVVVIEWDHYSEFAAKYNQKDQYLLKFIVHNVFEELSREQGAEAWSEWTQMNQLTSLVYLHEAGGPYAEKIMEISRRMQQWIGEHLAFTVSIGIGSEIRDFRDIHFSYESAREYIAYKPIFGTNQIIGHWSLASKSPGDVFQHLQKIRKMAQLFRLGEEQWRTEFMSLFQGLKQKLISKSELKHLMEYLVFHFQKEILTLAEEIRCFWDDETLSRLEEAIAGADTVDRLLDRIGTILRELEEQMAAIRNERKNHALVCKAKDYINRHYPDPNLSLNQVGSEFSMNARYLSRIFKEELGVNFIDYLVEVRMTHAARLLRETDCSIQEISEQVGYIHAMSFIRTFKKFSGSTPGEFRKRFDNLNFP